MVYAHPSISSVDFIKRERPLRLFLESVKDRPRYPRPFDILVIDEAHNVAPSGRGKYALDSQRTQMVRSLIPYFEHHLFLSATPHNGFPESFSALLELLDNQRFARGITPDAKQLETVMVRRLKRHITDEFGNLRFEMRQIEVLEVNYSDEERRIHNLLREYSALRRKHNSEGYAAEFVLKLLKKRLLSSPEAFHKTLRKHIASYQRKVDSVTPKSRPTVGVLRRQIAQAEEDYADDEAYEIANDSALATATRTLPELTEEEERLLYQMAEWAQEAKERPDSKVERLLEWLTGEVKPGGIWNDERVILFTEYRDTQIWLQKMLIMAGLGKPERLALIQGGMDDEDRERIKAAFQAAPGPQNKLRILLATDAASEGIDLQNYCHRLVHIEIPWNPNRLEQRNGRIDRMGQEYAPEIYHFAPTGYRNVGDSFEETPSVGELEGDLEFLMRAVEKVQQIREDLMGKVGDVIAEQVEQAMLGIGNRRRLDIGRVQDATKPGRALLRLERQLDEQIQKQIRLFFEQRHEMHLTPDHVKRVVDTALEMAGQPPLQLAAGNPDAYFVPPLKGIWANAKIGLAHPFTGEERPIVFDEKKAKDDSVVLAHLNHPLVLLAQRLLRAEVWSPQGKLSRVTARFVPDHALSGPAVVAHARAMVIGGGRYRLHEELIAAGGYINFGNRVTFRRMGVGELNTALDTAGDNLPQDHILENLVRHWDTIESSLRSALEVRMEERIGTIYGQLEDRAEKEASDIAAILMELAESIEGELNQPEAAQPFLPGFSPAEREQFQRDIDSLRARLERIPQEIEQEQAVVRARYSDLQSRLFPVAVTFLVPERLG
jgi:hypothetical protein